jgi:hypothetical protein
MISLDIGRIASSDERHEHKTRSCDYPMRHEDPWIVNRNIYSIGASIVKLENLQG